MSDHRGAAIWPVLHDDDTNTALRYLVEVIGFDEVVASPHAHLEEALRALGKGIAGGPRRRG